MAVRCAERISDRYRAIGDIRVRRKRCFLVQMSPKYGTGGVTKREHRVAFGRFFLPLFNRSGECLVFGADSGLVTAPTQGLEVIQCGDYWSVRAGPKFNGKFPYWSDDVSTPDKHARLCRLTLVLRVDIEHDGDPLVRLIEQVWDPVVFDNPDSMVTPTVLRWAKGETRRSKKICLAYRINPGEMRIGVIGSADVVAGLYARALDIAQASEYFGQEFYNEERGLR